MRILQLIDTLEPGGAERMAVNSSNLLAENKFEVLLCAARAKGAFANQVNSLVKVECLHKRHVLDIRAFFKLYSIIKKNKIQIIHAHSSSVIWATLLKLIWPNVKVIWHDHNGSRLTDKKNIIYKSLSPFIFGIITVNQTLYDWSQKNMNIKNKKNILMLNNFPNLNDSSTVTEVNDVINIVLLANLRKEKDHLNFLKAFVLIKDKIASYEVNINFAGLYWDNEYFQQIIDFIEKEKLTSKVTFLGSVENVSKLLSNSTIGVLTSISEGLPVSLLEYGYASLPVIVTDVGQCAEVVHYGECGIVVPPSAPQEMAKALLDLIKNPQKRVELGVALKKRIEKEYGAQNFLKAYQQLITNV